MFYYYAYSGHKYGLDCVRRGVALLKALKKEGIEVQLLVNDFRAGLAAKDLGLGDSVTIETILDVDAMAERGDAVILDTPEDLSSRLEQYADAYSPLFRVTDRCDDRSQYGEILLKPACDEDAHCIETPIVDADYFVGSSSRAAPKEERILFFYGDADYDKVILSHRDFFEGMDMDLLLGHYFFVKYEDELAKLFHQLHEPEEYGALLATSSRILTASAQCALEAKASGANVVYMKNSKESDCLLSQLADYGIKMIDRFEKKALPVLFDMPRNDLKSFKTVDNMSKAVINKLNL